MRPAGDVIRKHEARSSRYRLLARRAFERAADQNVANLIRLLEPETSPVAFLDLGCDDGVLTARLASVLGAADVRGVEIVPERGARARELGIDVIATDLNDGLPFDSETVDIISSNQVIEHVRDTDRFVGEIARVLRPGGYAVISTENLASWHNIAALILGWQPFSLTNVSRARLGLGNPLAVLRGAELLHESWEHVRVFAYQGLLELIEAHGLKVEGVRGAGYFPLPRAIARLDPRHAAFLTIKARKLASDPGVSRAGR